VRRLAEDDELRESLRSALGSAQRVYAGLGEQSSRKGAAIRLVSDPELLGELQDTVTELRSASERARAPQRRSRGKLFFVLGVIAAILFLNPMTGPSLRDRLSGLRPGGSTDDFAYGD
jgi:hypothetical protein